MSGQFTPGPWVARKYVGREDSWFVRGPGDEGVCGRGGPPVSGADARLIAAAPDLLSIVQRFVALPSGAWHPERHAAEEAELMQDARAALSKALNTGDTHDRGDGQ